jgi:hypothetical protein
MFRKSMPYLLPALLGGAAVFAWQHHKGPAPTEITEAPPPRMRTQAPRSAPQPTRLDFLSDTGLPYQARITRFRNTLATGCSEPEIRFLYRLLESSPPTGELPEHWYVIANDIMTAILANETDPGRFSGIFIGLLNSPHQPEVIRDYAVQHLATWLNPLSVQATATSLPTASPELAGQVLESLAAAATDPSLEQTSIPGTILMMLVDLKRTGGVDCSQAVATLKPWLTQALRDDSPLGNPIRVSAVGAAGILAPDEFRPLIRNIAYQENGGSSLRLPAIAALGQAGEAADLPKLREIAASSPELTYAAQDAVIALSSRQPAAN